MFRKTDGQPNSVRRHHLQAKAPVPSNSGKLIPVRVSAWYYRTGQVRADFYNWRSSSS